MPQPTLGDVHVNAPLTEIALAYFNDETNFVASQFAPIIPVKKQSDRYFVFTKDNWFRTEAKERGLSAESAGSGFDIDNTPTYYAPVIAVHKDIDDQIRANFDTPLNLDMAVSKWVMHQLLLKNELRWAAQQFVAGVWGSDFTPGTLWDAAGSNPFVDIRAQKSVILNRIGREPNTLVLGNNVWNVLQDHEDLLDRIKYTETGVVTTSLLASALDLQRVLVCKAVQNTAVEGGAFSGAQICGANDALLAYVAPTPGIMEPSAAYTFAWTGFLGAEQSGFRMKNIRADLLNSDRIEGDMAFGFKITGADAGVFISNATA